jgi:HAD superfamily hydrolase (TIGR01509 family)
LEFSPQTPHTPRVRIFITLKLDTWTYSKLNQAIKVTHVLFDMDGLLIDTERVYTEVSTEILARYGKVYDWALKSQLMGRVQLDAAEFLVKAVNLPITAQEYLRERNEKQSALFPLCKPLPGVVKLVTHLKKHNIPIAVCTSSHRDGYKLKTSLNAKLFDLFDGNVICGDDPRVLNGKPAPDIFIQGLATLGDAPRNQVLVFEDAPAGTFN